MDPAHQHLRDVLGQRLAEVRRTCGLSQQQVADHLGVSRQAVQQWETAKVGVDLFHIVRLSELFDVTVQALLSPIVGLVSDDGRPDRVTMAVELRELAARLEAGDLD